MFVKENPDRKKKKKAEKAGKQDNHWHELERYYEVWCDNKEV